MNPLENAEKQESFMHGLFRDCPRNMSCLVHPKRKKRSYCEDPRRSAFLLRDITAMLIRIK